MSDQPITPAQLVEALELGAGDSFAVDTGQRVDPTGVISYFLGLGDLRIASGMSGIDIPFPADQGVSLPIAHGLASTPTAVVVTGATPFFSDFRGAVMHAIDINAATFAVQAWTLGYTGGVPLAFYWIAIG